MKQIGFVLMLVGASFAADAPKKAAEVKDPVCQMVVDPKSAADKAVYKGKTYYFCSKEDKEAFVKTPEKYVKAEDTKKQ